MSDVETTASKSRNDRAHPREYIVLSAIMLRPDTGDVIKCTLLDLSVGGAKVSTTDEPFPVETPVIIEIRELSLRLIGRIIRVWQSGTGNEIATCFKTVDNHVTEKLLSYKLRRLRR